MVEMKETGLTREIPLTRGLTAIVDAADFDVISRLKWHAQANGDGGSYYPVNSGARIGNRQRAVRMHRLLLGIVNQTDIFVDHINGNGLDNRRCNLRLASAAQNQGNRDQRKTGSCLYKGVHFAKKSRNWEAKIGGERLFLGSFDTPEDAARAYDAAATARWGEYAKLNFPLEAS